MKDIMGRPFRFSPGTKHYTRPVVDDRIKCQRCRQATATHCVTWRTDRMKAPAFWYFCDPCLEQA